MPRVTLFDARHSYVGWDEARELSEATGLKPQELAITRPERLALHSVLIRVTSQLYVPDGPNYADLGISLREMVKEIHDGFVMLELENIRAAYEDVRHHAERIVADLLESEIYASSGKSPQTRPGLLARLLSKKASAIEPSQSGPTERARLIAVQWKDQHNSDAITASRRAIARTLGAVLNQGSLFLDRETIARVSVGLVMNRIGSAAVGKAVEASFDRAVEAKGYSRLPSQTEPLVLNAKGASASGKSSIRAAQREIAERLGYDWREFAIISPDYWRKALIDYDSLGGDHKYAAMLTGQELEIIDGKLDILMAVKGHQGEVPHMLIDRFRFDSFKPGRVRREDSTLLTRFGSKIYLFFLITPPAATVERAWTRGVETGRYKAVDDLLHHNVEAYSGMPDLFFNWAKGHAQWVHYEFLDNSVAHGERPRTIAYGLNGKLTVLDVARFCDMDRYRHVNVDANGPDEIQRHDLSEYDAAFSLRRAMKEMNQVDVLVPDSEAIFARATAGRIKINSSLVPDGFDLKIFGKFEETLDSLGKHNFETSSETIGTR